jgi:hypothetical protein
MNMREGVAAALSLGVALAVSGCGSGGAATKGEGGVSGCQPSASGLGMMSWLDDGTQECAVSALATFDGTPRTLFMLTGATTTIGLGIGVTATQGTAAIGGTYSCAGNDGGLDATLNYTQGTTNNTFASTCEITINMQGTAGVHATGTFSATLMPASGGTKSITNGVFDAPVTIVGGT